MTTSFEAQVHGVNINLSGIEDLVKKDFKNKGYRLQGIKEIRIYAKPEDKKVYYVCVTNKLDEIPGAIDFDSMS